MQKTLGWILLFFGLALLFIPQALPIHLEVEKRITTGISIGEDKSGMAPFYWEIPAILLSLIHI